jgi:hypothetical protein
MSLSREEAHVVRRRGRLLALAVTVCTMVAVTVAGSAAMAVGEDTDDAQGGLRVVLTGYQEDPLVISTTGNGTLRARVDAAAGTITYRLTYTALVGAPTQAHLHLGGRHQSGGVMVFLCSNLGNAPAGTPACPPAPGVVTGTLTAASMVGGAAAQGVAPGEFAELVAAIRAGTVYANVHSTQWPGGEIRGQLGRD